MVAAYQHRGVATWLVGEAADWLRLSRVDRLLEYAWPQEQDLLGLLGRLGFRELTRTARGWHHRAASSSHASDPCGEHREPRNQAGRSAEPGPPGSPTAG